MQGKHSFENDLNIFVFGISLSDSVIVIATPGCRSPDVIKQKSRNPPPKEDILRRANYYNS